MLRHVPEGIHTRAGSMTELPFEDAVELQNISAASIDLSGWFLSDNRNNPRRFRIPNGTLTFLPAA